MNPENTLPKDSVKYSSRESLIKTTSELIDNLQKRISGQRFRQQEGDTIKLGYARALIQAVQAQNSIIKDSEIDDLKAEIAELRELMKCQSHR